MEVKQRFQVGDLTLRRGLIVFYQCLQDIRHAQRNWQHANSLPCRVQFGSQPTLKVGR